MTTLEAVMNLQIRDPRARELAQKLAEKRKVSMTDAVIGALQAELGREQERTMLADRLAPLIAELRSKARKGGHVMTKDEVDSMWGHS
jgi:antitoxin VapB